MISAACGQDVYAMRSTHSAPANRRVRCCRLLHTSLARQRPEASAKGFVLGGTIKLPALVHVSIVMICSCSLAGEAVSAPRSHVAERAQGRSRTTCDKVD